MSTPVNWGLVGFASIHTVGMFKCNESGLFAVGGIFIELFKGIGSAAIVIAGEV